MTQKPFKIGLVMKSLQADFFKNMQAGAEAFAEASPEVDLVAAGTASQTEIDEQIAIVDDLVAKGVDALVVVPIDSKALVAPVVRAIKAGVKVVNIDIRLDEELLAQAGVTLPYVGPDNYTASKTVGEVLASTLPKGAPVVLVEGLQVAENAQARRKGFLEAIQEHGLDLVESAPADWETDKAESLFAAMAGRTPELAGVFCCNDAMALGVIRVLKKLGKAGKVPVVGFDNDATMQPLLADGSLMATIDAYGSKMAVEGIEYALKMLKDPATPAGGVHGTPFTLIKGS